MRRSAALALLAALAAGCSGSSSPAPAPTPSPTPAAVHLAFPDPFDESRFNIACDDVSIAQRRTGRLHEHALASARAGFAELSEAAGQALAAQVDDDPAGVLVVCRANGYRP